MDAVMSEEDAKASLIAALNNDTLARLDNHVSMLGEIDTTRWKPLISACIRSPTNKSSPISNKAIFKN